MLQHSDVEGDGWRFEPCQECELRVFGTFVVFVGVGDVHEIHAAHCLRAQALSDEGGVHVVWTHVPVFVLLVEDHVTVDLQQTRVRRLT